MCAVHNIFWYSCVAMAAVDGVVVMLLVLLILVVFEFCVRGMYNTHHTVYNNIQ